MTKDFTKYAKIIKSFRGKVLNNDFEHKFNLATKHIIKTERFLLKMELKRLAQPCMRLIDLRGLVDGECKKYEYNERPHFLDELAIRVFEENIAAYGSYTFGVYEAVTNTENNFRVIYQREKTKNTSSSTTAQPEQNENNILEKTQYPAVRYQFGPYFNRIEERMNFAIPFEVTFDKTDKHTCTSSDISVHGCKFRITKPRDIKVGDLINIKFTGLEQEFKFPNDNGYEYQVQNIQLIEKHQLIGAQRVLPEINKADGFQTFLKGFIQGNKRRYKVNLDNTINALHSRIFEQYLLPKVSELPIFVEVDEQQVTPRYCLTCHNNRLTYEYWQTEHQKSTLHYLISKERLERLIKAKKLGKTLWVYSFVHESKGQKVFYTADHNQLSDDLTFKKQFLGFCASKSTFAITQLSIIDVNINKVNSPITLSDTIEVKDAYLNEPASKDIVQLVNKHRYIVVATDITTPSIVEEYQHLPYKNISTDKIRLFGHKRSLNSEPVEPIGINYNNHRKEARFYYKTPVIVKAEKVTWTGKTCDFSVSGLKLELDKSAVLMKGDIVYLSFPELQKITSTFDLKKLPYEVVRANKDKTIFNLRVRVEKYQHMGRSFFKLLIEKNKNKLKADEYGMMTPELARALRNVYSQSMLPPSLIAQLSGSRYKYEVLTANVDSSLLSVMNQLSERTGEYNLYPLLHNLSVTDTINSHLKRLNNDDAPISEVLYIAYDHKVEGIDKAVVCKSNNELKTTELKAFFIKLALKKGQFFCIKLNISRSSKAETKHLSPELSYVGSYAIHRGKQLEQEIESVTGVIQFFDITEEAMLRYKIQQ